MKKARGKKTFADLILLIVLLGGIVFTTGFGINLIISRNEVTTEVNKKVNRDIDYLQAYIDGNLSRIEDASYSLGCLLFGDLVEDGNGTAFVRLDESHQKIDVERLYSAMEKFLLSNPVVCGIAIEFESGAYPEVKSQYGFTPYVTTVSGKLQRHDLGELTYSYDWEWYRMTSKLKHGYWANPFQDSSEGHVIACHSIPVLRSDDSVYAVIAVDIDTEAFSKKCAEISPYPNAQVVLLDRDFNFISHPDTRYLMSNVTDFEESNLAFSKEIKETMSQGGKGSFSLKYNKKEYIYYFSPVPRTGWIITIECPEEEIFGSVNRMKRSTTLIALISVLLLSLILSILFQSFQKIFLAEADVEKDLNIASLIQNGMLPTGSPSVEGFELDISGFLKPAKTVGGDLYYYFAHDGKLFFCVGDVSGKGIPASLYMVVTLALFLNITKRNDDASKIMSELNNSLSFTNFTNMFCTMFLGVLDIQTGRLEYCNAGHNKPIIFRGKDSSASFIDAKPNVVLGIMENFPFEKETVYLSAEDRLFLYTDGLTEAENKEKKLFGDDAALKAVTEAFRVPGLDAEGQIKSVHAAVLEHTGKAAQNDDITMVIIRKKD